MRNKIDVVVLLYALLSIGLGLEAFLVKHSIPSIAGGGIAGLLLLGCLALGKSNPRAGRIGASVVTLLLLGKFLADFAKKGAWYPAGIMTVASAFVLAVLVGGHFAAMRKRKASEAQS